MLRAFALAAVLALSGLACETSTTPEEPVWGKQPCAACAMLVSDPASAAQLITHDGNRVYFDDVGCMAAYVLERSDPPKKMWVRDANGKWLDARSATYKTGARTPMDYGFLPSPDGDADWHRVELAARERKEKHP